MFPRLKKYIPVYVPVAAGLLVVALVTVLGGLWQYRNELDAKLSAKPAPVIARLAAERGHAEKKKPAKGTAATRSPAQVSYYGVESVTYGSVSAGTGSSSAGTYGATGGHVAPGSTGSYSSDQTSIISVALSINGSAKGTVKVKSGSTQCDVLSQALYQGVISSLDMRYDSQYGTEGVFVIDGMGDHGTVWWTYQVNGYAPPYGCGYVTARAGDHVNWQYVK